MAVRLQIQNDAVTSRRNGVAVRPPPPTPQHRPFVPGAAQRLGLRPRLLTAKLFLGLGTTGSELGAALVQRVVQEFGRVPGPFGYALIDAAAPPAQADPLHCVQIGVDGAGTDPRPGRELFLKNYQALRGFLDRQLEGVFCADPAFPTKTPPRQALDFWLVAGCGATSGGALDPALTLLHDLARKWDIVEPRVHVLLLGPEIALRDRSRSITPAQEEVVRATAYTNLARICGDLAADGYRGECRPDGTLFTVVASQRVWSPSFIDRSNGVYQLATVQECLAMAAEALLLRLFTPLGIELANRFRDFDQLGKTGRGICAEGGTR